MRMGAQGVRDSKWSTGFARLALKTGAPVLPVHIRAQNSPMFYGVSMLAKPLASLMLVREMFGAEHARIGFQIGEIVSSEALEEGAERPERIAAQMRRHVGVRNGLWYQEINLGPGNGTLPDGRISYWRNTDPVAWAGGTTPLGYAGLQRYGNNPLFGAASTYLTNTGKGESNSLTLSLNTPFKEEGFSGGTSLTVGRATEVNPGTSSQAASNFSGRAAYNPNEDVAYRSNYDVKARILGSLTWQHKFFGDYATSVSAFYDGHSGQPYSFVYGNDANGDGIAANDLFFVPANLSQVAFVDGTRPEAQQEFMMKPIIVSRSSGWNAIAPSTRRPSTPPTSATGTVSTTTSESRSERNIAAMSRNSTRIASTKFFAIVDTVASRRSALPARRMFASAGSFALSAGTTSFCSVFSASSSDSVGGGSIVSVTVRRWSSRRIWFGPSAVSSLITSPSGTTCPDGDTSGASASDSGVSRRSARRMIGRRVWPSKYSPSHAERPSVADLRQEAFQAIGEPGPGLQQPELALAAHHRRVVTRAEGIRQY